MTLDLSYASLPDRALKHLASLRSSSVWIFSGQPSPDKGLRNCRDCPNSSRCTLETGITSASSRTFRSLVKIRELGLAGTQVTDEIMTEVQELKPCASWLCPGPA